MAGGGGGLRRSLGLGFIFGAKDEGAVRTTQDIGEGMDRMAQTVREVGRESMGIQRLGNFIGALNLRQLSRVGDAMEGLAQRAGALAGEISSTSIESHGAQFAQEYRAATAGLGEYRAEVDAVRGQISSLSFDLGVGSEGMLNYATSVARAGRSIDDYGLSMRDIAGLEQAGISNGQELAQTLTELDIGFGMGADGARQLVDQVVAIGTRVGSGSAALQSMRGAVEAASEAISQLPPGVEMSVDQSVRGMTMLAAGAQRVLGGTFETAMQGAVETFQRLAESRQQFGDVLSGMSGDFPALTEGIARAFGSVDQAMSMMMDSPEQFVMNMQQVYAGMDTEAQRLRFQREVLSQFPDQIRHLVMAGEEGRRTMQEVVGPVGDVSGALSDMARSASGSTRTFAESMELVEERFRAGLDRMVSRHYRGFEREVIQRQQAAYGRLTDTVERFAGGQGAMGVLTRSMLAFRRGGFTGLIEGLSREGPSAMRALQRSANELSPALGDRLASAFGKVREEARDAAPWLDLFGGGLLDIAGDAMPTITGLGAMGLKFDHISGALRGVGRAVGPFMLLIGAAAGIYYLSRNIDRVEESIVNFSRNFAQFGTRLLGFVQDIDWNRVGQEIVNGFISLFTPLGRVAEGGEMSETARNITEGFRNVFRAVGIAIRGMVSGLWERIVEWVTEPEDVESQVQRAGMAAGATIGTTLGVAMLTPLRGSVLRALGRMFSGFGQIFTGPAFDAIRAGGGLRGAGGAILRRIPYLGAVLGVLFDLPDIISSFRTEGIAAGLRQTFSSILNGLLMGIPSMIQSATGVDIGGTLFDFLRDALNIDQIVQQFQSGNILRGIVETMFAVNPARMLAEHLFGEDVVDEYLDGVTRMLGVWWEEIQKSFGQFLSFAEPIFNEWMEVFGEIGDIMGELWDDTLQPLLADVLGFSIDTEGVGGAFDDAEGAARGFGGFMRDMMDWLMPKIQWLHREAMPLVVAGIRRWADNVRTMVGVWREFWRIIGPVFQAIGDGLSSTISRFRVFAATWDETKAVLVAGFRWLKAEVERYLIVPFLRVGNTMTQLAAGLENAFLGVKLVIMQMFQTLLTNMTNLAEGMGPIGAALVRGLQAPLAAVTENIATVRRDIATNTYLATQSEINTQRDIATAEQNARNAREEVVRAEAARQLAAARVRQEQTRERRAAAAPTRERGGAPGAAAAPTRAGADQRAGEEAAMRARLEEHFGGSIPAYLVPSGSRGFAVPTSEMTPEEIAGLVERGARVPTAREARALGLESEEGQRGARQTAARRQRAREQEGGRRAEEIARAIEISSFGEAARRQLAAALRGGAGGRGGSPGSGRARPSDPGTASPY